MIWENVKNGETGQSLRKMPIWTTIDAQREERMFKKFAILAFIVVVGIMVSGWALRADQADAKAPTVTRTVLNQQDLPMPGGFASALVRVQLPVGAREGRHQHPGTLIATVAEGTMTLEVEAWAQRYLSDVMEKVTDADFIMVALDKEGRPTPVPQEG